MLQCSIIEYVVVFPSPRNYNHSNFYVSGSCTEGTFPCGNSTVCVPQRFICNGHTDCPNGEDENVYTCSKYHVICSTVPFQLSCQTQPPGVWFSLSFPTKIVFESIKTGKRCWDSEHCWSSEILRTRKTQRFGKWIFYCPQVKGGHLLCSWWWIFLRNATQ
jgi:hypothetical protein